MSERPDQSRPTDDEEEIIRPRDVVLECGHVVCSAAVVRGQAWCPFAGEQRRVLREHDGVEVPKISEPRRRRR